MFVVLDWPYQVASLESHAGRIAEIDESRCTPAMVRRE